MKDHYYLINGKLKVTNTLIKEEGKSFFEIIKNKVLSIVAAFYIYDRIELKFEKGILESSIWWQLFFFSVYGALALFIILIIYYEFFKTKWINKLKVEDIEKVIISIDEDEHYNTDVELKSKFSSLDLTFRSSEKELDNFIRHLKRLNSRFTIENTTY